MIETVNPVYTAASADVIWTEPTSTLLAQDNGLIAVSIFFFITATVTTGLRLYTRVSLLHNFGPDDWTIVISLVKPNTHALSLVDR